jgi:hypothetical protein
MTINISKLKQTPKSGVPPAPTKGVTFARPLGANSQALKANPIVKPALPNLTIDFFTPVSYLNKDKSVWTHIKEAADDYFDYGLKKRAFEVSEAEGPSHKVALVEYETSLLLTIVKIASWATFVLPILALAIKGIARSGEEFAMVPPQKIENQPAIHPHRVQPQAIPKAIMQTPQVQPQKMENQPLVNPPRVQPQAIPKKAIAQTPQVQPQKMENQPLMNPPRVQPQATPKKPIAQTPQVQPQKMAGQPVMRPLGFPNTGNSCWFNSCLQLLIHVPAFQARISLLPVFEQFFTVYDTLRKNLQTVLPANNFYQIRQFLSDETKGRLSTSSVQYDSAEVLNVLLVERNKPGEKYIPGFDHQLAQVRKPISLAGKPVNAKDKPEEHRLPPIETIQINFRSENREESLQDLFGQKFVAEDRDRGNGQVQEFQDFFLQPPDDILIQAVRFLGTNRPNDPMRKNFTKLQNPHELKVTGAMVIGGSQGANYVCDAFVVHNGGYGGGHYVAYVKIGNEWWYTSDGTVNQVTEAEALNAMKDGYIFHYAKV